MAETVSYDILESRVDYSTKYLMPREVQGLFNEVGTGANLVNSKFHWWETYLAPRTTTLNGAYTAGDGVMTVTSVEPFSVGTLFEADSITFHVSAINETTKVITVAVIDGADADIADASTLTIVSTANIEGSEGGSYDRKDKIQKENVSQILREIIRVSGTAMEQGKEVGGAEAQEALTAKIQKMRRDLASMLWSKVRIMPTDNTSARIAGGVPYFVGNKKSGAFTGSAISTAVKSFLDEKGAMPTEIWMNPSRHQTLSETFDATYLRRDINDGRVGRVATTIVLGTGEELTIKTDVNIPADKLYVMNSRDVIWRPLRPMRSEPLGKKGDYYEVELLAEVSIEVNPSSQMLEYTVV